MPLNSIQEEELKKVIAKDNGYTPDKYTHSGAGDFLSAIEVANVDVKEYRDLVVQILYYQTANMLLEADIDAKEIDDLLSRTAVNNMKYIRDNDDIANEIEIETKIFTDLVKQHRTIDSNAGVDADKLPSKAVNAMVLDKSKFDDVVGEIKEDIASGTSESIANKTAAKNVVLTQMIAKNDSLKQQSDIEYKKKVAAAHQESEEKIKELTRKKRLLTRFRRLNKKLAQFG